MIGLGSRGAGGPSSATVGWAAAGGGIGGDEMGVVVAVLLESQFVGEQMAEEIVHGERFDPGGHGGDERVIFWTQTSKKIRDEFEVIHRLTGGGKSGRDMFEPLEIIGDGGRSFLCGGELVVQVQSPGSDGGGEALVQRAPEFVGSAAAKNLGKKIIGYGSKEHAEDQLILPVPMLEFRCRGDDKGRRPRGLERGWVGAIDKAI